MAQTVVEHLTPDGGVVVGHDGSPESTRAVQYAVEEGSRRGCTVDVVRAWSITSARRPPGAARGAVPSLVEFQDAVLADAEKDIRALVRDERVAVQVHAVHHPAVRTLIEASRTADVLVVGRRGHGGFGGLVIGSVADQCVRHAACVVVVVR